MGFLNLNSNCGSWKGEKEKVVVWLSAREEWPARNGWRSAKSNHKYTKSKTKKIKRIKTNRITKE